LFLPTIIRELRSLTKVTLVIYVYDVNGMMAACLQFNITKKLMSVKYTDYNAKSHDVQVFLPVFD